MRYLAPNLVTALGVLFGLTSIIATYEGRYVDAGWLIIWAVFLDRVDGLVARSLKATSEFGLQMDSFADAINFGVAPAFLIYVSLSASPGLGFESGAGRILLLVSCAVWVLANVFRLAKFNVVTESKATKEHFFGVATTLAAGVLVIWYIVLHKYAAPGTALGTPEAFSGPHILGSWRITATAWAYFPAAMLVGALLMVSNLPTPKLGLFRSKLLNAFVMTCVALGYLCGFMRFMPDFMAPLPTSWVIFAILWGQFSSEARGARPPPWLPAHQR